MSQQQILDELNSTSIKTLVSEFTEAIFTRGLNAHINGLW